MIGPRPPALILGTGITALGTIRSLGKVGIPTYVASNTPDLVAFSRWYNKADLPAEGTPTVDILQKVLQKLNLERAVLLPCADNWVRVVASMSTDRGNRFVSSVPPVEIIELLVDKWRFANLVESQNIPSPRTTLLKSLDDFASISAEGLRGSFLKPCDSQSFMREFGVKAWRIETSEEALKHLSKILTRGFSMVLQEYIPGPPTAHYFVDGYVGRDGRMSACFCRRRLRMFPPDFGNSTYMLSVPNEEVRGAIDSLTRLWPAIGYYGIFSAEFKFDFRDSQFKILEVNPRPWWYIEFATLCGVNIAEMSYRDALDMPIEPVTTYRIGRRAIFLYEDRKAYRELASHRRISLIKWLGTCLTSHEMTFHWRDPLPSIMYFLKLGMGYARHRFFR